MSVAEPAKKESEKDRAVVCALVSPCQRNVCGGGGGGGVGGGGGGIIHMGYLWNLLM